MVQISRYNWRFPTIASCCQPYRVLDDEAAVLRVIVAEHIVMQPGSLSAYQRGCCASRAKHVGLVANLIKAAIINSN